MSCTSPTFRTEQIRRHVQSKEKEILNQFRPDTPTSPAAAPPTTGAEAGDPDDDDVVAAWPAVAGQVEGQGGCAGGPFHSAGS